MRNSVWPLRKRAVVERRPWSMAVVLWALAALGPAGAGAATALPARATLSDLPLLVDCMAGPGIAAPPIGCTPAQFDLLDVTSDGKVNLEDFAVFQRVFSATPIRPKTVHLAVVDPAGQLLDVGLNWQEEGETTSRLTSAGVGRWYVKEVHGTKATVEVTGPGSSVASMILTLPTEPEVGVLIRRDPGGIRAEITAADALPIAFGPTVRSTAVFDTANVFTGARFQKSVITTNPPTGPRSNGDECDLLHTIWHNGSGNWSGQNALSAERRSDGTLARWLVDDVVFTADMDIDGLHWWGNESAAFRWAGTADYIILDSTGPGGGPGQIFLTASHVPATRSDTGDTVFGDPVWFYSLSPLSIHLPAGRWWIGVRTVQDPPIAGQGWRLTADVTGGDVQLDYGPSSPGWDGGAAVFGQPYNMSMCITGAEGQPAFGACCDDLTAVCEDCTQGTCPPTSRFLRDGTCGDLSPACGDITGACCDPPSGSCAEVTPGQCAASGGQFLGNGIICQPDTCPCVLTCPPGSTAEGEPTCGPDYIDRFNGGCNTAASPVFSPVSCGEVICGQAGTFVGNLDCVEDADCPPGQTCAGGFCTGGPFPLRDTDWYAFTLAQETQISWTVKAKFAVLTSLFDASGGCASLSQIVSNVGDACDPVGFRACLVPGTYYLLVTPEAFSGVSCNANYTASLTCDNCPTAACCMPDGSCVPDQTSATCDAMGGIGQSVGTSCMPNVCPFPPVNDTCDGALDVGPLPATVFFNNNTATNTAPTPCGVTSGPFHNLWYSVTGTGNLITAETCATGPNIRDTKMSVFCNDCAEPVCVGGNDDACNALSRVTWCSQPGTTYLVTLGNFGITSTPGNMQLDVIEGAPCNNPPGCTVATGACCENGLCGATTPQSQCAGQWFAGEGCPGFACPAFPSNESCVGATAIPAVPFSTSFDNDNATADGEPGACNAAGTTVMQNDLWFSYSPPADCVLTIHVDPETAIPGYDGIVTVYQGADCNQLMEQPDPNCAGDEPEPISLSLLATGGLTYWIQIGDWGSLEGGGPTAFDLDCPPAGDPGACCFDDGACAALTFDECLTQGGIFEGVGSSCSPNLCPQPLANDDCASATPLSVPGSVTVDTTTATDDVQSGSFCGTGAVNQAVWYQVLGTGNELTASTCNAGGGFDDTKLQVWCASCNNLTCVDGQDDDPACSLSTRRSTVTWCSQPGTPYLLAVGGFGTSAGAIELSVTQGPPCSTPPSCTTTVCTTGWSDCSAPADWISRVLFQAIDNTTSDECGTDGLGDYSTLRATVVRGNDVPLSVSFVSGGFVQHVWAWIDWNQDLVFSAGEAYDLGQGVDTTLSVPIHVPMGAELGPTRMRITERFNVNPGPCDHAVFGETEDYTVEVTPALPLRSGPFSDDDNDTIPNFCDNCPADPNPSQEDTDGDGTGDICDNCPAMPSMNLSDVDGDGVGDICDNCPAAPNPIQQDADQDGSGNPCDRCPGFDDRIDEDQDTVPDGCDQCPGSDDNAPGALSDDDGDGVSNCKDQCNGLDDAVFAPGCASAIPTVTGWGLLVLLLLLLTVWKVTFHRRESAV